MKRYMINSMCFGMIFGATIVASVMTEYKFFLVISLISVVGFINNIMLLREQYEE